MGIVSSFLIALSLSADNLAVTVSAGAASARVINQRLIYEIAVLFATAHFIMFSLGFLGGTRVAPVLGRVAPWIACAILIYIGAGMLWQAWRKREEVNHAIFASLKHKLLLALATSVDAFLVGTGFGFTGSSFWQMAVLLVICVGLTSTVGFKLGDILGRKFGRWAETGGGAVLIILGVKLLL